MPVRKRVDRRRAPLDLEQSAILRDEPRPEGANPFYFLRLEKDLFNEVEDLWKSHRDDILAEYVAKHPECRVPGFAYRKASLLFPPTGARILFFFGRV